MDEPVVRYELQPVQFRDNVQDQGDDDQTTALRGFSLPPVDKGKDAWLCLVGACLLEMTVWGSPFSFGVFQDFYTTTEPFAQYASRAFLIGSCSMGILYLASPFSLLILQRWPGLCRISSVAGLVIAVVGILSSAFATTVWQLLATQGIIYPIGACTLYYPVLIYIDEWFVRRKGLAYGICWAGSGLAGIIFPFIVSAALSRYSYRTTVCAWAVIMVLLVCPFLPFVKPRTPVSAAQVPRPQKISFQFMWSRPFLIFQLGSIVQSLGYFAPTLYLPTYSRLVVGESGFGITAPLTLMNAGITIGFILMGFLIDQWHVANVIFLATVFTVLAFFAIWGMSVSLSPLLLFAIVYGIFAGSASATWPGIVQEVKETEQTAPTGIILGLLTAGRGMGSIACGPISELLINAEWPFIAKPGSLGYGTNFGSLIVFTGVTAVFGALGFVSRRLGVPSLNMR